jgi:hypothetical protein
MELMGWCDKTGQINGEDVQKFATGGTLNAGWSTATSMTGNYSVVRLPAPGQGLGYLALVIDVCDLLFVG